jgi:hypothetical protein
MYAQLIKTARDRDYVAWFELGNCYVNLNGDYDYLESPYYISQEYEFKGKHLLPTCKEMLDAYIPPIFLEKAQRAGIPVAEHYISNGYFEPPVIIDPINPFMIKSRIVLKPGRELAIAKSMTRKYTYAICCQKLPEGGEVKKFRSVLGWTTNPKFRNMSKIIWEVFHIPLATVRVIIQKRGEVLLSDISPLEFEELHISEFEFLKEHISWAR